MGQPEVIGPGRGRKKQRGEREKYDPGEPHRLSVAQVLHAV
jgi:hypothetical protein